ncbi:MAG: aldehyde ferredoxin oxidoreductase C-terminal domain-containing protein [Chloroflexota bacterium]|nr:aldehyde ferredoxin oxidoreductase C-terminal domain-containing protein [Chloroflexota bacterium]
MYGYHGKILHVDLSNRSTRVETPDEIFYRLYAGGGLLGTYYLLKDTPAGIDALSPDNRLIFANSVIAGYPAAGLVRYVVTAKSPLTNGIGETRCEGRWAVALKKSGYDAIIVHGAAATPIGLLIDSGQVSFFDADDCWGQTVGAATDTLEARFGADIDVAAIGTAGENGVRFANIVSSRTHQAQRMGMGAVMGSKKLKAIVLRGGDLPPIADSATYDRINADFERDIPTNTLSTWQKELPGFAVWVHTHGLDAALITENFRTATFKGVEAYAQDQWLPMYQGVAPCPGCANDCMKLYHADADLDPRASAMHQEITGTLGPNIGTTDIRVVMRFNNLCNQWGLDPVSLGFTLSFAMEAFENGILTLADTDGLDLRFGNHAAALEMTRRIVAREGFGAILAEGSQRAAAIIGKGAERYALHVKGLELVPFEPRTQTNLALGYATAPIGPRYDICEHDWDFDVTVGWEHSLDFARTLGILERIPMEYVGSKKVRNYKALNTLWSGADALAFCIFAIAPTRVLSLQHMTDMLAAITGWETSSHEILRWGERRNHLMRVYNNREGLGAADDGLPDRFFDDPIDSGVKQGTKLDRAAFASAIRVYYEMMGWDENGVPRPATLYDHHLEWVLED